MKKKCALFLVILGMCANNILAQSDNRIKNKKLIFNADMASGSLYTMAASSVLTGLVNYYVLHDAFFENSFMYGLYSTGDDNLSVRTMNPMGLTARELFNNLQVGLKLGYQSYTPNFVNAGIYASAHYKLEQFRVGYSDDNMQKHRAQRALFGVTGLLSLGSMQQASRVIIEAGLRYSMAVAYTSPNGDDREQLNDGLVSHYAIKLASRGMLQNIGVFADVNHFSLWKNQNPGRRLDGYTLGITWTITPQQMEDR